MRKVQFHLFMPKRSLYVIRLLSVFSVLITGLSWSQPPSPAGGGWLRLGEL